MSDEAIVTKPLYVAPEGYRLEEVGSKKLLQKLSDGSLWNLDLTPYKIGATYQPAPVKAPGRFKRTLGKLMGALGNAIGEAKFDE